MKIFSPLQIKSIVFPNRIWVSPMCQYSCENGQVTDWHLVHLGSRAVGGAGLVMVEATGVSPEGRISPGDTGIWSDAHVPSFKRITQFLRSQGAIAGIQIAHAGRKASTALPWDGGHFLTPQNGGWETVAPSPVPFTAGNTPPREMSADNRQKVILDFRQAALRAHEAGFQVLEIHMAHGYLLHEYLSPLSNRRDDDYGGSLENRMRFPLEVAEAVRKHWPLELPLFTRISATDWADGPAELSDPSSTGKSWKLADSIVFSGRLKALGIDLIDCSSGGMLEKAQIPTGPGYQVPFAEAIRREAGIKTAAVGMITEPSQAEAILAEEKADAFFMAREFLRNPYWPSQTARASGIKVPGPKQYGRA